MKKIGFTTSIPVEVIYAAGFVPVDLNNIFITNTDPGGYIDKAENAGFPRNTCAWIKGIYSAILDQGDIDTIIGVVEGDCSNTRALIDVLNISNIRCIPFSYPHSRDYNVLKNEIEKLAKCFNIGISECIWIKQELDRIRKRLSYLDELTWAHNKASGFENHIWQVSSSDFKGNYIKFAFELDKAIEQIEQSEIKNESVRIGYIGVPPIISGLYDFVEALGSRVVYNEVQRQFTMADGIGSSDLVEVYRNFSYPYDIEGRLKDISNQIQKRNIDGLIHYTQSFCFRGIEDIVIRKKIGIPVLNIEGDRPGVLDARTRLRIEAFIDIL